MKARFSVFVILALAVSPLAHAQGVIGGAQEGSADGAAAAGPVGAVVGGAVGAVTGGVAGLLGLDQRALFHEYVLRESRPSYVYKQSLRAGDVLMLDDVIYYPVPPEFGMAPHYRYAIINDEAVIVDPHTHRIVQVID